MGSRGSGSGKSKKWGHFNDLYEFRDSLVGMGNGEKLIVEKAIEEFTLDGYIEIRTNDLDPRIGILEGAIAECNRKWNDGPLYRGISIKPETLEGLVKGAIIDQDGISSWSSDREIAEDFAVDYSGKYTPVVLVDDTPRARKGAMSIKAISLKRSESEVLYSGKSKFKIIGRGDINIEDNWTKRDFKAVEIRVREI